MKRRRRAPRGSSGARWRGLLLGLAGCALLLAALGSLPPGCPRPDPILVLTVAVGARWGTAWGSLAGFLGGLTLGWVSPGLLGGYALIYAGIGWVIGLSRQESGQGLVLLLLLVGASTVAAALALSGLGIWLGEGPSLARVQAWMPGAMVFNLLLVAAVRAWLAGWERR